MSAGLVIQHAKRLRRIVACDLSGCAIFFHIIHKMHDFRVEKFFYGK